jgi:hypothetical protein
MQSTTGFDAAVLEPTRSGDLVESSIGQLAATVVTVVAVALLIAIGSTANRKLEPLVFSLGHTALKATSDTVPSRSRRHARFRISRCHLAGSRAGTA